jgi:hypothetical protein
VFGLALMFCGPVRPATYHVDQSHAQANDDNPGTEALPWKTINHAATVLKAGDTVLVKKGTYNVGASPSWAVPAVNPSHSGTQCDPIKFKAHLGHAVQITTTGGQAAIGSNSRDYIVWEGFVVNMANRAKGILVMGAKGCTISHCEVIGNYIASTDNHDGIRIERAPDCRVHHCIVRGVKGNSINSAGIKVYSKGAKRVIIEDNYIYDNTAGVFDKDFGVENTYRRNYFTRNRTQFYGNNQGGPAKYYIYDNVFDGEIELHAGNTGTEIHDNLLRCDRLAGAWAGGVISTKIWNNIVISKSSSITACQIKKQQLSSALAYMDYNIYDANPIYDFGEYTSNHQRFLFEQMQSVGFETNSHVVSSTKDVFEDEKSYRLLPRWKTVGRYGDAAGPANIALVLDIARYGPFGNRKRSHSNSQTLTKTVFYFKRPL